MISLWVLGGLVLSGVALAEGRVARAIVTTAVVDREPVNDLEQVSPENAQVIFFTELRNMAGQSVKHRWNHGGEALAEVEFTVGGPRWRVWSTKKLLPEWTGEWKLEVLDGEGNVLREKRFSYGAEGAPTSPPAEKEPPAEAVAPAE